MPDRQKCRHDRREAWRIRRDLPLWWAVSPDRQEILGPFIGAPEVPGSWTLLGFHADTVRIPVGDGNV